MYQILIIDDDPDMREAISSYLRRYNLLTDEAESAEEALEMLKSKKYHAATLDMVMEPGIGGAGFIEQYSQFAPDLSIIVLTGYPNASLPVKAIPEISNVQIQYLEKPIAMKVLVQAIRNTAVLKWGGFIIDVPQNLVMYHDEQTNITGKSLQILANLAANPDQFVTYEQLVSQIYFENLSPEAAHSRLKSPVYRLRQELTELAGDILETQRNKGIRLKPIEET